MDSALSPRQQAFVSEYLVDRNATKAATRAGYSAKTAYSQGQRLLKNAEVKAALDAAIAAQSIRTEITADAVLKRWWDIATADPREIVTHRRGACRYCYGIEHDYQWRTEREFDDACAEAAAKETTEPRFGGGTGYDHARAPNPVCPECSGHGVGYIVAADVADLSGPAALLYDGVKPTQAGIEIKLQDRSKALENVAKHLGMFDPKNAPGSAENPLSLLIQQVQGTAFPIVHQLPSPDDEESDE